MRRIHIMILLFFFISIGARVVDANTYLTKNNTWDNGLTVSFWTSLAIGDINNDGLQDLVQIGCTQGNGFGGCAGYLAKVYLNNGSSFVENSNWESGLKPVHYGSLALG